MRLSALGWLVFMALAALVSVVSLMQLGGPLAENMPHIAHYLQTWALHVALLAHITAGPLALLLAPLQLIRWIRNRWPWLHRWIGRIYVLSVGLSGSAALVMLFGFKGSAWALAGFAVVSVSWLVATWRGYDLARKGQYAAHRRWMIRSIALTAAAISLRLIMTPLIMMGWSVTQTYDVTGWASWIVTLTLAEILIRFRK